MSREAWAALIGLTLGTIGTAAWTHWRVQVVHELRLIRKMLEEQQEPTLHAIRELIERLVEGNGPLPGSSAGTEEEAE